MSRNCKHVLLFGMGMALLACSLHAAANPVVLDNRHARYLIGPDGKNVGLIDRHSGIDSLAKSGQPFATIKLSGKTYPSTSCVLEKDRLTLRFQPSGAVVLLSYSSHNTYFIFEVAAVSDPDIEELTLLNLPVRASKYRSGISGLVGDDNFSIVLRSLDLKSNLRIGGNPAQLAAVLSSQDGFTGARIALVATPTSMIRPALQAVMDEQTQPKSLLGGPWALNATENRGSYVFADVSETNVDDWIALAKKAGLAQAHFIGWERAYGHYPPRPDRFPHGVAGMKAVVEKIHAAGLRAGMHTLTGCISPHDAWSTPIPDPRLAYDARLTLNAALDEKATAIPTLERPEAFDTVWAYSGRGNVLRIDNELIQYGELGREAPFGFRQCKRGAFGTRPARHAKGAPVDHLYVRYQCFQPDANSTLVDELAQSIADVFNTCGFDMIYMDGAEGMDGGWRGVGRMREAIFRRLKGRVLVEASEWGYHSWTFHSRLDAWDYPNWGLKRFTDEHCRSTELYRHSALLPTQLGWWAILGPGADHPSEFPDEIEYLCAKSLAWDAPMSFQGITPGKQPPNARQDEYLDLIGRYERLRLANHFPQSVRERLRAERQDFHLIQAPDGKPAFVPIDYAAHKVTGLADGSSSWTVENRYSAQNAGLRIEALYGVASYDSTASLVLADFAKPAGFAPQAAAPRIRQAFDLSHDQVKTGKSSGRFQAWNDGDSRTGAWARAVRTFSPEMNLKNHEALGVWVHGDGKGELLNFQLTNPNHFWQTCDEHYVKVDFTGWRYFELLLRERDAEAYADYQWPYGYHSTIYRNPLIKDHTSALNLYYNHLPPREGVTCYISPIKALPVRKVTLRRPVLTLNGRQIVFPVSLESGFYLEVAPDGKGRLYSERGALLQEFTVPALKLNPGANQVQFTCDPQTGTHSRAKVTISSCGAPLQ